MSVKLSAFLLFFGVLVVSSCQQELVKKDAPAKFPSKKKVSSTTSLDSDSIINRIARTIITNRNVKDKLTAFGNTNRETKIVIYTTLGTMTLKLYTNTPLHRANFVMLAKKKFYDNTLFYRIIDNFMIQGGNSDDAEIMNKLNEIGGYRIPNEIKVNNIHKKGALAMAVPTEEQSLGKKSSSINFYLVEGQKLPSYYFKQKEEQGKKYTNYQKKVYQKSGGTPHLDGDYTVFGEIVSGFEILSKISKVKVDKYNWPVKKVIIDSIRAY